MEKKMYAELKISPSEIQEIFCKIVSVIGKDRMVELVAWTLDQLCPDEVK